MPLLPFLAEHGNAGQLAGDEVGRGLDPAEAGTDASGQRLGQHGLADSGHVLDEQVTTGQQGPYGKADRLRPTPNDLFERLDQISRPVGRPPRKGRSKGQVGEATTTPRAQSRRRRPLPVAGHETGPLSSRPGPAVGPQPAFTGCKNAVPMFSPKVFFSFTEMPELGGSPRLQRLASTRPPSREPAPARACCGVSDGCGPPTAQRPVRGQTRPWRTCTI